MSSQDVDKLLESLSDEDKENLIRSLLKGSKHRKGEDKGKKKKAKKPSVSQDFIVQRKEQSKGKEPVKAKKNTWVDDGAEHSDISTPKFERTPRRRSQSKKVEVECHVCGKVFKQDSRYVYGEFQRCNRCTGR